MADNQLHNLYSKPIRLLRTEFADKLVQSAIRPVQLDFYGQDFLEWVVESSYSQQYPIVHIGDACDVSCTGEFLRFLGIMRKAKHGWLMVPGNHDGFFYGNTHPVDIHPIVTMDDWRKGCLNAGEPMTKDMFVRYYMAALLLQLQGRPRPIDQDSGRYNADVKRIARLMPPHDNCSYTDEANDGRPSRLKCEFGSHLVLPNDRQVDRENVHSLPEPQIGRPLLRAVSYQVDAGQPWRSFVVQQVDLTIDKSTLPPGKELDGSVRGILLDTAQYKERPVLVSRGEMVNAGVYGELLDDSSSSQVGIVRSWLKSHTDPKQVWVLLGHHPFRSLSEGGRVAIDDLRKTARVLLYVSAHTHAGQFIVNESPNETGKDHWLELNVGSILDWALEFRTFQLFRAGKRWMLFTPRHTMDNELGKKGLPSNDEDWEAKPGNCDWDTKLEDCDYYLRYEELKSLSAERTEIRLQNTLLAAHHRLLRFNKQPESSPDDPFWPTGCQSNQRCRSNQDVLAEIERVIQNNDLEAKTRFLLELDRFERERPLTDEARNRRQRFRLSQALWASKYDSVHSRKPLVDDWRIVFPEE